MKKRNRNKKRISSDQSAIVIIFLVYLRASAKSVCIRFHGASALARVGGGALSHGSGAMVIARRWH